MNKILPIPKRAYQELWETIRDNNLLPITIECHPELMDRIIKAVMKEKLNDLAFKLMNTHDTFKLEIVRDREKGIVSFKLKAKLGIEDIVKVC